MNMHAMILGCGLGGLDNGRGGKRIAQTGTGRGGGCFEGFPVQ